MNSSIRLAPWGLGLVARRVGVVATCLVLVACGGGGGDSGGQTSAPSQPQGECANAAVNTWLQDYFSQWYFWNALTPRPQPQATQSPAGYFASLLYAGGDPVDPAAPQGMRWPRDRWSGITSTESFNQFFGEGKSMGYGVQVAGLEVAGRPDQALYVRYVEPLSPAGLAGVARGDEVVSINDLPASSIVSSGDYSALSATQEGAALKLTLRRNGLVRTDTLVAAVYALTPVTEARVIQTGDGRRVGYIVVKDMINQVLEPWSTQLRSFKQQSIHEVVVDLRYNGGGYVSVARSLAGDLAGPAAAGRVFTQLRYNPPIADRTETIRLSQPASADALSVPRVYVLTGRRTCSASEMLVNGLRGLGVSVVVMGETSCGKPFGFLPTSRCGSTYSAVNFESVNALGQGRYFEGLPATCPVAEDFQVPLGSTREPLLAQALAHQLSGQCSAPSAAMGLSASPLLRSDTASVREPFEINFMVR